MIWFGTSVIVFAHIGPRFLVDHLNPSVFMDNYDYTPLNYDFTPCFFFYLTPAVIMILLRARQLPALTLAVAWRGGG